MRALAGLCCALLASCGGGGGGSGGDNLGSIRYRIGGSVSGLTAGASVVLSNNAQETLTLASNGTFSFITSLASATTYDVVVVTQPLGLLCAVNNASGTVNNANITNVLVTCAPGLNIGGTVSGLGSGGTVVLLMNGGDPVSVSANSSFQFPAQVPWDTIYLVSVGTQPTGQTCAVNYAKGVAILDVSNIIVQCTSEEVLWSFGSGFDGAFPSGPLILGGDGNFYGVTDTGGTNGRGTVYRITPSGVESVLLNFDGVADGSEPMGALVQGPDGNFYGTTAVGGAFHFGTVYKVTPDGVETVLWNFGATAGDGQNPEAGLLLATDGNFYGTTLNGGSAGYGTVFKITPAGAETVLWNFWTVVGDANNPRAPLIQASDGNFYGTSSHGGAADWGTIFEITPAGAESVLWSFIPSTDAATTDGIAPVAPLLQASDGTFYGTTYDDSAIFKYNAADFPVEHVLWRFQGTNDGGGTGEGTGPESGLIMGADGNFYGTTASGGTTLGGTAYRLTPTGIETVLWNFGVGADGQNVQASLIEYGNGTFYGTTTTGGANGQGTIFKLTP